MEEKLKEIKDTFTEYKDKLADMFNYSMVSQYKSIKRAIRRGHIDATTGIKYPNRPFNNRKPTPGRHHNEMKKRIYEQLKGV